jgi:hydrogenase maturation protease
LTGVDPGRAPRVVVYACGDPLRGDDAIGPRAVGRLPAAALAGVEVRVVGALAPEHLSDLPAGTRVVIVDAVVGPEPGRIVELDLGSLTTGGLAERVVTTSSHQLPLDQAVALGQLLRDAPLQGRFVGLGIGSVAPGAGLSDAVGAALPAFRAAIERAITREPA